MGTEIKCKECGKVLNGGYYNTLKGPYCVECWEKKPMHIRKQEEKIALSIYASIAKRLLK